MRVRPLLLMITGALACAMVSSPAATAAPQYQEYVALGDSWTADVLFLGTAATPTTQYAPLGCLQSTANYPKRVARALGVARFADASCGAATTEHFAAPQSVPLGVNPPQFARLTPQTDLVTVGIGGNDAGLAAAVLDCLNLTGGLLPLPYPLGGSCRAKWTAGGVDQMSRNIDASEPKVVEAVRQIRRISPNADIFLVNYLAGVREPGCYPIQPASNADQVWLAEKLRELNAMVARAARASGARLIDTYTPSIGHDACQSPLTRWVEGFVPLSLNQPAIAVPFHPNTAGADAQAAIVLAAVTQ